MPCIKFDTFKQWYSVNPKAWRDHGYYYNCVYKDVNNGSICLRMTWLDSFKLRQFWKTASSIKQYKVADKHLEAVLLSVQEDIKKFKENNPVYKYEKGEDIF